MAWGSRRHTNLTWCKSFSWMTTIEMKEYVRAFIAIIILGSIDFTSFVWGRPIHVHFTLTNMILFMKSSTLELWNYGTDSLCYPVLTHHPLIDDAVLRALAPLIAALGYHKSIARRSPLGWWVCHRCLSTTRWCLIAYIFLLKRCGATSQ